MHVPEPASAIDAEEEAAPAERRSGFGIGSFINRMSGSAGDAPARRQPSVASAPSQSAAPSRAAAPAERTEEQDKIEIPAFLRRQAN